MLGKPADHAAVMGRLSDGVAGHLQLVPDVVEQCASPLCDPGDILEDHQLRRLALERLQHEANPAHREAIQRLIAWRARRSLVEQAREPLTGGAQKDDVWALTMSGASDVVGRGWSPADGRGRPVEVAILLLVEQVQNGPRHSNEAGEVADRRRVGVHATDTPQARGELPMSGVPTVEANSAAASSTKEVKVCVDAMMSARE